MNFDILYPKNIISNRWYPIALVKIGDCCFFNNDKLHFFTGSISVLETKSG